MFDDRLGRLIKAHRVLEGLRQEELALRVGVSPDHLSHVERGARRPSAELLRRLVVELGVPASPQTGGEES